jgi:mannose-1-phosphate guanylyltransferase
MVHEVWFMSTFYAVIMAGGRGERFWPLSTDRVPKPFIPLLERRTLIQQTVDRLLPLVPPERMLISIGELHREIAAAQLPQIPPENFIIEPVGRDTAPCLGYCALHIEQRDPDAALLALPADHYIADPAAYRRTIEKGIAALPGATGVVFGIRPVRPETGYGYIQAQAPVSTAEYLPVLRFVEKPDMEHARRYQAAGDYFWNSGMFIWRNRTLLKLIEEHMQELHQGLAALRPLIGRKESLEEQHRIFASLPRISIDFGIMEKSSGLRLVPAEFIWDDIGNWGALARALPHDANGNVSLGAHVAIESSQCIAYSDAGVIATFGVSDLIVIHAQGKVLVCSKDRAGDLKRVIAALGPDA